MIRSFIKYILVVILFSALAARCAKQAAPQGGPRDLTPPRVVKSLPQSGITNFRGKSIVITFDEYVTLDKLNEKFMISPPMAIKPRIALRGKSLVIDFLEEPRDSTTYTLYFQDAIRDLNEGNPYSNFQFVFSTGNTIDSLSLTGNIVMANNLEAGKDVLVMLYRNTADSAPARVLPDYVTLADENGYFRINNIGSGTYRLYGLTDNNNNKKYDLPEEGFAFYDSLILVSPERNYIPEKPDSIKVPEPEKTSSSAGGKTIQGNTKKAIPYIEGEHKLYLFIADKKKSYLSSSSRSKMPYQMIYILSVPPGPFPTRFSILDPPGAKYFTENTKAGDTLTVWLTDSAVYSRPEITTLFTYPYSDSTGNINSRTDTIKQRFIASRQARSKPLRSTYRVSNSISSGAIKPAQKILFTSPTPFREPDTSRIQLFDMANKDRSRMKYSLQADSGNSLRYLLGASFKSDGKYLLVTDSAAFGNIYGEVSDSSGIKFTVRPENSFGHLTIIAENSGNLLVQLLDNKEKLISEGKLNAKGTIEFPMLERGFYRVRAIFDLNDDGKWTTGSYEKRRQPEPVSYFPKEIEIKVDWNIDEEWSSIIPNSKERILVEKKEENR